MERFSFWDLEKLVSDVRPSRYGEKPDLAPVIGVLYQDALSRLGVVQGVNDVKVIQDVNYDMNAICPRFVPGVSVFVHDGRLAIARATDVAAEVDSQSKSAEQLFMEKIREAAGTYTADSLWDQAVRRKFSRETAKQFIERKIEEERAELESRRKKDFRYVCIYKDQNNLVWTFDGEEHLWKGKSVKSEPATLCLVVGCKGSELYAWGDLVVSAQSPDAILERQVRAAGLVHESGSNPGKHCFYYADRSREQKLFAAFDKLAAMLNMTILQDERNKVAVVSK